VIRKAANSVESAEEGFEAPRHLKAFLVFLTGTMRRRLPPDNRYDRF
jgi:hypothetical protein